jgi:hypothetical protein
VITYHRFHQTVIVYALFTCMCIGCTQSQCRNVHIDSKQWQKEILAIGTSGDLKGYLLSHNSCSCEIARVMREWAHTYDVNKRRISAAVLAIIGEPLNGDTRDLPALNILCSDKDAITRHYALHAIGGIPDSASISILMKKYEDNDDFDTIEGSLNNLIFHTRFEVSNKYVLLLAKEQRKGNIERWKSWWDKHKSSNYIDLLIAGKELRDAASDNNHIGPDTPRIKFDK